MHTGLEDAPERTNTPTTTQAGQTGRHTAERTSRQHPVNTDWDLHTTQEKSTELRRVALEPGGTKLTRHFNIKNHTGSGGRAARPTYAAQKTPPECRDGLRPRREPGPTTEILAHKRSI